MLTSGVVEERDSDGHRLYQAKVAYRYAVDGQEIVGHRAFFGDSGQTSWSVFVRRIVDRYPPGSDVTVYYDPSRPEEAVIVRGVSGAIVAILAFQLVFIALATWFLRASVAN